MSTEARPLPHLSPKDIARFHQNVERRGPDDCWPWKRSTFRGGYGQCKVSGRNLKASRIAFYLAKKHDPYPWLVCHTCDNPRCCNPAHLFTGTNQHNLRDCQSKGRLNTASGERHRTKKHPELVLRGERVGGSKLDETKVIEIRNRFASGESQREIAETFGVTREAVGRITQGRNWKHVGGPICISDTKRQGRSGDTHWRHRYRYGMGTP